MATLLQPSHIRLFYSPGACSFAPHFLLFEAGIDFEAVTVQRDKPTEELLRLNPKARVPVLVLNGEDVITEVPAIMTAISYMVPDKKLLGSTPLETVRVYEWLNWLSGTLHGQGFGGYWRASRFIENPTEVDVQKLKTQGYKTVQASFKMIEEKLVTSDTVFAVGRSLTVVDAFLAVFYRWGFILSIEMKTYKNYTKLWDALNQRPAFVKALSYQTQDS
jgi:glutathione S-transferase